MFNSNREGVDLIISEAKEIFLAENMVKPTEKDLPRVLNDRIVTAVMNVIADAGIIYLSTKEDVIDLWDSIRAEDESGLGGWLMQSAITWRIRSIPNGNSWNTWCTFLAEAYSQQRSGVDKSAAAVCVDDDTVDRLARLDEFKDILINNPWFTYLVTLQLSWHEIYADLVETGVLNGQVGEGES
tara:strand:+ start:320 stop:871 length:552 start_codon:yes stop_codon:yes gene_type:complete